MSEAPWFVYIITTDKNRLYTGISTDIARRLQEHQAVFDKKSGAKGAKFFRSQKPLAVVYQERFTTKSEALKREREIKLLSRSDKLTLLPNNTN